MQKREQISIVGNNALCHPNLCSEFQQAGGCSAVLIKIKLELCSDPKLKYGNLS